MLTGSVQSPYGAPPLPVIQHQSFIDRILHRPPTYVVNSAVVGAQGVDVTPAKKLNVSAALRNTAIGGAIGGALGGVAMLVKHALPLIGKVTSLGGIAKLAGAGAGIGLATAVLPVAWPELAKHPALKAAVTGAGIGSAIGTFLPIPMLGPVSGAIIGAGIGMAIHFMSDNNRNNVYGFCGPYGSFPPYGAYPQFGSQMPIAGAAQGPWVPLGSVTVPGMPGAYGQTGMPGQVMPGQVMPGAYGQYGTGAPMPGQVLGLAPTTPVAKKARPVVKKVARKKVRHTAVKHGRTVKVTKRVRAKVRHTKVRQVKRPANPLAIAPQQALLGMSPMTANGLDPMMGNTGATAGMNMVQPGVAMMQPGAVYSPNVDVPDLASTTPIGAADAAVLDAARAPAPTMVDDTSIAPPIPG